MLLFVLIILSDGCLSNAGLFVLFELGLLEFAGWSWAGLFPPEFPVVVFEVGDANMSESKLKFVKWRKRLSCLSCLEHFYPFLQHGFDFPMRYIPFLPSSFPLLKLSGECDVDSTSCNEGGGELPVKETAVGWCLSTCLWPTSDSFRCVDSTTVDNLSWFTVTLWVGCWDITSFVFSSFSTKW